MSILQLDKLKRDPKKIASYLVTKNNITSTTEELSIYFPARFVTKKLAFIDTDVRVVDVVAIVDSKHNYAVASAPIFIRFSPAVVEDVKDVDERCKEYKRLVFPKGSVVIPNTQCIKQDSFVYDLFDELINNARIPWYLNYEDVASLFNRSKEYFGKALGANLVAFELMASVITRSAKDKRVFLRHAKNQEDYTYVGIKDVIYSYNNTGAKLFGNYLGAGITSAVLEDEEQSSSLTNVLRR